MISVIIPAHNDAQSIRNIISYVRANSTYRRLLQEIIVVDAGSTDNTVREARDCGAKIVSCHSKNRGAMLNIGARHATGKIIYFLSANALPPKNFVSAIVKAFGKGFLSGTFSIQFDTKHWLLNSVSWISNRFSKWVQVSDQSLFVSKELFDKSGGFREDHLVMANQEFIKRLRRYSDFVVLKDNILSSAKKYVRYGIFRTGFLQATVYLLHKAGYSQHTMAGLYRKFLRWDIGPKMASKKPAAVQSPTLVRVADTSTVIS